MSAKTFTSIAFLALTALALPLAASAQVNNGIFGCNQTGAIAMSVGSTRAIGGTFVPVADSATELNTGYLVYKECVLRPVVDAQAHALSAGEVQATLQQITQGNNGNPYWPQYFGQDQQKVGDQAFNNTFFPTTNNLNPAFQAQVQTSLARNYQMTENNPSISLACPYGGNLTTVLNGTTNDVWGGISAMMNPACSPYSAYTMSQNQLMNNVAAAQYAWVTQLNWGNGIYANTDQTGRVITPGIFMAASAEQALTSPLRQVENANDIGQMVTALFAGMTNRILNSAVGGLASINTPTINPATGAVTPSYLSQMTAQASGALGQAVTNVALSILSPALAVEQQYNQTENAIATNLIQTIQQLRGAENTCWRFVVQNVCTGSSTNAVNGQTCSGSSGSTLHIATSTAFSQPIVDSQIQPLAAAVAQNITTSNQAVSAIQQLVASVQNASAPDIQRNALSQLDTLVAQGTLHSQNDVNQAAQNLADVQTATQKLLQDTAHLWAGDDTANGINGAIAWNGSTSQGWCNVPTSGAPSSAQQTTINLWNQIWGG